MARHKPGKPGLPVLCSGGVLLEHPSKCPSYIRSHSRGLTADEHNGNGTVDSITPNQHIPAGPGPGARPQLSGPPDTLDGAVWL
jgi:hypothetical protein